MITAESIKSANERVKRIEIGNGNKKKLYVSVAARVAAFREMCPTGLISTSIIEMADGVVTMIATIKDENGKVLATGLAQEKEANGFINKSSYIENCETSAVGRALGMLGIGSDEQMASVEEMVNALNNQNQQRIQPVTNETIKRSLQNQPQESQPDPNEQCNDIELASLEALCKKAYPKHTIEGIFPSWPHLTKAQYAEAMKKIQSRMNQ